MDQQLEFNIKVFAVTIDCDNSDKLADFYAEFLSWNKNNKNPEWISVSKPNQYPILIFQQVSDYKPPKWPDEQGCQRQMVHMDFAVSDIEIAKQRAIACGANVMTRKTKEQ